MGKRKITINDVAMLAGTSRGTVDRVINNRGKVAKPVEARVRKVIEDTGYKKSFIARNLSSKEIVVGVIIGTVNNSFFDHVLNGIHNELNRFDGYGIRLIIKETELLNPKNTLKGIDELSKEKLDCLIVSAQNTPAICKKLNQIPCKKIAVNIDLDIENKLCFIGSNYYNCGCLAANIFNLMYKDQFKNIGIVIGSLSHGGQVKRLQGFKDKLSKKINILKVVENDDNNETSYKVCRKLLKDHKNIDGICFLGSGIEGGLSYIKDNNKDISVVTVDQSDAVVEGLKTGLVDATITQHAYSQGVKSIDAVFDHFIKEQKVEDTIFENNVYLQESIVLQHNKNN